MPTFGNPLGFLALAAIPAILAIHFLQRESHRLSSSTLFLLERLAPESAQGSRFERLRSSVPLWLQLAAALIAAWLLAEPRWIRPGAAQHIVIVVDSTVSMLPFRDEMLRAVDDDTAALARAAIHTEWQLLESDVARPTLYSGADRAAMLAALRDWKPHLGTHDPTPQLDAAQNLLGGKGLLIFVSDRKRDLPDGAHLLAVGRPFDHCGFAGLTIDGTGWHALVRNNGGIAQSRTWWIEAGDERKSAPQTLALDPDATAELSGTFPPTADGRCELAMDADAFTLDSRLPMLRPALKHLAMREQSAPPEISDFFKRFEQSLDRVDLSNGPQPADLVLALYTSPSTPLPAEPAIVFVTDATPATDILPGSVTAAADPLAADVSWSGLLVNGGAAGVPASPDDETLVWQGGRPLIFLRHNGSAPQLVVNFDIRTSNAARLPAFVLLLHRFAEQVRAAKVADETRNFETNQPLDLAADPRLPAPVIAGGAEPALRAPAEPGFFRVTQGQAELLDAAAHFADARAADFRNAASVDDVHDAAVRALSENSQADLFAPAWLLALGVAMLGSWTWRRS